MGAANSQSVRRLSRRRWIRRIVQIGFLAFVLILVVTHFLEGKGVELPWTVPDLHAICPFGAVETLGRLVTQQKFIPKIHESNFWILLGSAGTTLLLGALFCGWLCPLGSVQEWFGDLGRKLFGRNTILKVRRLMSPRLDRILGALRYVVLAVVVVETTRLINLVFSSFDPYYALMHFWTGEALWSAVAVLSAVLVASLFYARPWCRWFCPFGAVHGVLQLAAPWKIRRNAEACIGCGKCSRACPMSVDVAGSAAVRDSRCNRCGGCIDSCPVKGALDYSLPGKRKLSLRRRLAPALAAVLLFSAPILTAKSLGLFKVDNAVSVAQGTLKPEEISGSMTVEELAHGLDVKWSRLKQILDLPPAAAKTTKIRDLEDMDEELTTPVLRARVEEWLKSG